MNSIARNAVRITLVGASLAAFAIMGTVPAAVANDSYRSQNPQGGQVLGTVSIGPNPQDAAFSPDGAVVYVTTLDDGMVRSVDLTTLQIAASTAIGGSAGAITVGPSGAVTVADAVGGRLVTLGPQLQQNGGSFTTGSSEPISLSTSQDGTVIVFADPDATSVGVVDNGNQYFNWVPIGGKVWGIDIAPAGGVAYVANQSNASVAVLTLGTEVADPVITSVISIGGRPAYLAVSNDGSRVYVANAGSGAVTVIDTASASVVASYPVGGKPWGIAVSPDGLYVYVCDYDNGTLIALDARTGTVLSTTPTGTHPDFVAVSPDGTVVAVPNSGSGTVSILSGYSDAVQAQPEAGDDSDDASSGGSAIEGVSVEEQSNSGLPLVVIVAAILALAIALAVLAVLLLPRLRPLIAPSGAGAVPVPHAAPIVPTAPLAAPRPPPAVASPMDALRRKATDPSTAAAELAQLARLEALRPLVAVHPNAYPDLLEWLAGLGEPAVTAALRSRR